MAIFKNAEGKTLDTSKYTKLEGQQAIDWANQQSLFKGYSVVPDVPITPTPINNSITTADVKPETVTPAVAVVNQAKIAATTLSPEQIKGLDAASARIQQGLANSQDIANVNYAKQKKGYVYSAPKIDSTTPQNTTGEKLVPKTIEQQVQELLTKKFDTQAANDQYDVPEKSATVLQLEAEKDELRNKLDYNQVLQTISSAQIKNQYYTGKEDIENKVIPMEAINGQLSRLSEDVTIQLDKEGLANAVANATNTYRYNSKLIEYNIALGDLQNAQSMVKESAQDFKDYQTAQLQILQFKNQIDQQTVTLKQAEIDREYEMATNGYTYIQSPSALQDLAVKKGTEWVEQNTVNIGGKIYIKPQGTTDGSWSYQSDADGNQFLLNAKTGEMKTLGATGDIGGQCGAYINNILGTSVGDSWESKQKIANTDLATFQSSPQAGDVVIFKTKMPYGHIAAVTKVNGDGTVTITESNWNGDEKIGTRTISAKDASITGIYRGATFKTDNTVNLLKKDGAPIIQKVNGKDYWITKDGDLIEPSVPAIDTTKADDISNKKAEDILDLKSSDGLGEATGIYLGRTNILPAAVVAASNFIAGVEQIVKDMTLDKLINAKASGATFGALSDAELALLAESASKISSWRVTNKKGKTTGYKTDEQSMKDELQKMYDLFKKDARSAVKPANSTPINIDGGYTIGTIVSDGNKNYKVINAKGDLEEVK